jgi:hypothetical protein
VDWDEEERILFDLMERDLTEAAQMGGQALAEQLRRYGGVNIGVDWNTINEAGRDWIMAYGAELAKAITQTTQEQVRNALAAYHATPGMTRGQLEQLIMEGPDGIPDLVSQGRIIPASRRAENIAVTEVTRSYSGGEVATMQALGVEQVAPTQQPPAHVGCRCDISPFTRDDGYISWKWLTLNDDLVCPICRVLHGKDVGARSPRNG